MRSAAAAAVLFVTVALPAVPAHAAPSVDLTVTQLSCPGCDSGEVQDGGVVTKSVRVSFSSSSNPLRITSVEIQARVGSDPWFCMRRWTPNQFSFSSSIIWDTRAVPDDPDDPGGPAPNCRPDSSAPWGERTLNEEYDVRVVARDEGGAEVNDSQSVHLSNAPEAPRWAAVRRGTGNRAVEVKWFGQPGEGVVEYKISRVAPDGTVKWFGINAKKPKNQSPGLSCTNATSAYSCTDKNFPQQGYAGKYVYSIYSYRSTLATQGVGVGECMIVAGRCIGPESGIDSESVTVKEPPPPPSPTASSPSPTQTAAERERSRQRSSGPNVLSSRQARDFSEFYEGEFTEELPFGDPGSLGPTGRIFGSFQGGESKIALVENFYPQGRDPTPYRAAAGGILLVLVAAHMARALRHGGLD